MAADSSNWNWGAASSRCRTTFRRPSPFSCRVLWEGDDVAVTRAAPTNQRTRSQPARRREPIKPEKKVSLFVTLKSFSSTSLRQKSSSNGRSCIYQQSTMILLIVATFAWTPKRHVHIITVVQIRLYSSFSPNIWSKTWKIQLNSI